MRGRAKQTSIPDKEVRRFFRKRGPSQGGLTFLMRRRDRMLLRAMWLFDDIVSAIRRIIR